MRDDVVKPVLGKTIQNLLYDTAGPCRDFKYAQSPMLRPLFGHTAQELLNPQTRTQVTGRILKQRLGLVADLQGLRQSLGFARLGEQCGETASDAGGKDKFRQTGGTIAQQGTPDTLSRREIRRIPWSSRYSRRASSGVRVRARSPGRSSASS